MASFRMYLPMLRQFLSSLRTFLLVRSDKITVHIDDIGIFAVVAGLPFDLVGAITDQSIACPVGDVSERCSQASAETSK